MGRRTKDILTVVVIIVAFFSIRAFLSGKRDKDAIPYLVEGEKIHYFDLVSSANDKIDISSLKKSGPSVIFIFSRPCSPCDKNILYWRRMAEVLKGRAAVYGIVVGSLEEMKAFADKAKLNFGVYAPADLKAFVQGFRLKLSYSQTILYADKVKVVKVGNLEGEDATRLLDEALKHPRSL